MQELAKKVSDEFDGSASVDVDDLTAKQIAEIDRALKGEVSKKDLVTKAYEKAAEPFEKTPVTKEIKTEEKTVAKAGAEPETEAKAPVAAPAEAPVAKRASKQLPANMSAETGAALRRFDSLLNGVAKPKSRSRRDIAKNDAPELQDVASLQGSKEDNVVENAPALSPELKAPEFEEAPVSAPTDDQVSQKGEIKVDFFTLRRSLRQLQFNYSINKPHDDSIKDEFDELLSNFSGMSVQYQQMVEEHSKSVEDREKLQHTEMELVTARTELQKAHETAKNADLRRTKDLEAFAQLTARQNAARAEVKEAHDAVETMRREVSERAQEYESKSEENVRLAHEVSLAEAEKGVLRESLSEACDKIAELLSGEHRFESMIQELEDEVAHLKAVVSTRHIDEGRNTES